MLGRCVTRFYRAAMNFLSRRYYSRVGVHYTTNPFVPISARSATAYDRLEST